MSLAGLFLFCFAHVLFPLQSTDIWWQIHTGQYILEHGFPINDPFTSYLAHKPWIDLHWVYQLWVYTLYSVFGVAGLVGSKCIVFSVSVLILVSATQIKRHRVHWVLPMLLVPLCLWPVRHYVLCRPVVISLFLLACTLWILEQHRRTGAGRILILLPVVQVIWANSQPLYPIGLFVVLIYWVAELPERWFGKTNSNAHDPEQKSWRPFQMLGLAWLSMLLVCFANPYGLDGVMLPWQLFFRIDPTSQAAYVWQVSENVPTWQLVRQADGAAWAFVGLSSLAFASFFVKPKSLRIDCFLLLTAFFGLALMANRNLLLFSFVAVFVLMKNLARLNQSAWLQKFEHPYVRWSVAGLLVTLGLLSSQPAINNYASFRVPTNSAAVLNSVGVPGNLFNSVRYGGYLGLFCPGYKPFIDGRLMLTSATELDDYLTALEKPDRFLDWHQQYNFQAVILPTTRPDRYRGLIATLYQHEKWRLVATNGSEVLFLPHSVAVKSLDLSDANVVQSILEDQVRQYGENNADRNQARIHLGRLLALVDQTDLSEHVLAQLAEPEARLALAQTYLAADKLDQSRRVLEVLHEKDNQDKRLLALLARVYLQQGELDLALELASTVLQLDPYHAAARLMLQTISEGGQAEAKR